MGFPSSLFVFGLLYLALLGTGGGNGQGGVLERGGDDLRLLVNALRVIKLEEKLEGLKEKLDGAKIAKTEEKIYSDLETRVFKLEGTGCRDNEIQCGGDGQECISDLLVCDGVEDCHNGHDEDPSFCDVSGIKAGMSFTCWYSFGNCMRGGRKAYFCKSTLTNLKRSRVFPNEFELTNVWHCDWGDETPFLGLDMYKMTARYEVAHRRYVEYNYGYINNCYFPNDNFNELHCNQTYGTITVCNPHMICHRNE